VLRLRLRWNTVYHRAKAKAKVKYSLKTQVKNPIAQIAYSKTHCAAIYQKLTGNVHKINHTRVESHCLQKFMSLLIIVALKEINLER
jgi:hypothetical protein